MGRSRSRSQKKSRSRSQKKSKSHSDYPKLESPLCHLLPSSSVQFTPEIKIQSEIPKPNADLGDYNLMISTKSKIDPYVDKWDSVKFLLNDYEVVDIYRNRDLAQRRYTEAIIDYKQQSYIFSRAYFKIWEVIDTYKVLGKIYQ